MSAGLWIPTFTDHRFRRKTTTDFVVERSPVGGKPRGVYGYNAKRRVSDQIVSGPAPIAG